MLDEMDSLQTNPALNLLLSHYANLASPDRDAWHPRLSSLDGFEPREMTKLHGDLLALGWIEWTSGQSARKLGEGMPCYRVTADGLRAYRMAGGTEVVAMVYVTEEKVRKFGAGKREKKAAPVTAEA